MRFPLNSQLKIIISFSLRKSFNRIQKQNDTKNASNNGNAKKILRRLEVLTVMHFRCFWYWQQLWRKEMWKKPKWNCFNPSVSVLFIDIQCNIAILLKFFHDYVFVYCVCLIAHTDKPFLLFTYSTNSHKYTQSSKHLKVHKTIVVNCKVENFNPISADKFSFSCFLFSILSKLKEKLSKVMNPKETNI